MARTCALGPRVGCGLYVRYTVTDFHTSAHTYVHSLPNAVTLSHTYVHSLPNAITLSHPNAVTLSHTYVRSHPNAATDSDG